MELALHAASHLLNEDVVDSRTLADHADRDTPVLCKVDPLQTFVGARVRRARINFVSDGIII
jgi:hypothetical protein